MGTRPYSDPSSPRGLSSGVSSEARGRHWKSGEYICTTHRHGDATNSESDEMLRRLLAGHDITVDEYVLAELRAKAASISSSTSQMITNVRARFHRQAARRHGERLEVFICRGRLLTHPSKAKGYANAPFGKPCIFPTPGYV